MPTLGLNTTITLSTNNTRQSLDSFYRGISVDSIQTLPYAFLSEKGEKTYCLEDASFFLFVGDVYDGSNPFDIVLTNIDDEEITIKETNFAMLNADNLMKITIKSGVEDKVGYKLIIG